MKVNLLGSSKRLDEPSGVLFKRDQPITIFSVFTVKMKSLPVVLILFYSINPALLRPDFQRFTRATQTQSCDSLVYCQGRLLDTVQLARIFADSKTFVDMSQIESEMVTLNNFDKFMQDNNDNPTKEQILEFVHNNFEDSAELEDWTPIDFTPNPAFLDRIKDKEIRQFATDLVSIWPSLGRKIKSSVNENPEQHSLLPVSNGFIIPGGRFKELYYWDSYWIIEGLLLSEMVDTARGMMENLLDLVDKYGFVPNGGRVYYLNRSQPPLLTNMAGIYYDKTGDIDWIKKNIDLFDRELTYWINEKSVEVEKHGVSYKMAHYISQSNTPRPESYYEDIQTCSYFKQDGEKEHCYQGLKSGAESGWDFSSRWVFDQEGGVKTNLSHIDAQRVVPVDLNAFLCSAFKRLSSFYGLIGNTQKQAKWQHHSVGLRTAIEQVLYDVDDGIWYDLDTMTSRSRKMFFPSNFAPLWAKSYDASRSEEYGQRAADYFTQLNIGDYKGGIPTSLVYNNEQWDLPNAWPPLQEIIILGLWDTGNLKARKIARREAERWVKANLAGYKEQNAMFEKYDATRSGQYGGGGEYEVQKGFGWTNGVCLNLINIFYTNSHHGQNSREDEDSKEDGESKGDGDSKEYGNSKEVGDSKENGDSKEHRVSKEDKGSKEEKSSKEKKDSASKEEDGSNSKED